MTDAGFPIQKEGPRANVLMLMLLTAAIGRVHIEHYAWGGGGGGKAGCQLGCASGCRKAPGDKEWQDLLADFCPKDDKLGFQYLLEARMGRLRRT